MKHQEGTTMLELITVICIVGIFAAIAVPGASRVRSAVSSAEAARRLATVLRAAQAEAQSRSAPIKVEVASDGDYAITGPEGDRIMSGRLGTGVTSNYPDGVIEFTERGWARLPGSSSPRAGHFSIAGASGSARVVVQLAGCVRCT
jgi:type IV fimbrial biogenesis protein FimU